MLPTRDPSQNKDLHRLKVRGWKKKIPTKLTGKKAGVAILISDKIDFKIKAIKREPLVTKKKNTHYFQMHMENLQR